MIFVILSIAVNLLKNSLSLYRMFVLKISPSLCKMGFFSRILYVCAGFLLKESPMSVQEVFPKSVHQDVPPQDLTKSVQDGFFLNKPKFVQDFFLKNPQCLCRKFSPRVWRTFVLKNSPMSVQIVSSSGISVSVQKDFYQKIPKSVQDGLLPRFSQVSTGCSSSRFPKPVQDVSLSRIPMSVQCLCRMV